MRCLNCSGQFKTIKGDLHLSDKILGVIIVPDTEWDKCNRCGEILYSAVTMADIERTEEQIKTELLLNKPLREFILGTEVAEILGCTRQAVHKHKRIRRGFIHFVKYNNNIYYLRASVERYKETGDGRIQLSVPSYNKENKVINFRDYLNKKGETLKTGCFVDAGSDSPCTTESSPPKKNIPEKAMIG